MTPILAQTRPYSLAIEPIQNPDGAVEAARKAYEQGQFKQAIVYLQKAEAAYEQDKNSLKLAMTLSNLSLAYQKIGEWQKAEELLQQSLSILQLPASDLKAQRNLLALALEVKGQLHLAKGQPDEAFKTWQQAGIQFHQAGDKTGEARTLLYQVSALQALGHYRQALKLLLPLMPSLKSQPKALEALALRTLSNVSRVVGESEDVKAYLLASQQDQTTEALENWQVSLQRTKLSQSYELLKRSLTITGRSNSPQAEAETLLSLGNLMRDAYYRARDAFERVPTLKLFNFETQLYFVEQAMSAYQKAEKQAVASSVQIQSQLNQLSFLVDIEPWLLSIEPSARDTIAVKIAQFKLRLNQLLNHLPKLDQPDLSIEQATIYARINLAESLIKWYGGSKSKQDLQNSPVKELLDLARAQAAALHDSRAEIYVIGSLASFYEALGTPTALSDARKMSQTALKLAEDKRMFDLIYRWQWQLGRVLKKQGKTDAAIIVYEEATKTLDVVRQDLATLNSADVPFSFRNSVEPVYRQLVDLLLQPRPDLSGNINHKQVEQKGSSIALNRRLDKARQFIQELQVLELENFLRCRLRDVVNLTAGQSAPENSEAAFIYPILLDDRLELLLRLPGQSNLIQHTVKVGRKQVEITIEKMRQTIIGGGTYETYSSKTDSPFQNLYEWLFQPIKNDLGRNPKVKTLVFAMDGALRSLPIAALHDGKEYLIEKGYGLALNIGLESVLGRPLKKGQFKVLAAGISIENLGALALKYVENELQYITHEVPGSETLLNEKFKPDVLQNQINSATFAVIHIATHGLFSGDAENTYVDAYEDRIDLNEMRDLLRRRGENRPEPIELLVLSACQTAIGDTRAALGIAGMSIQAGANSTIASLFNANDESTAEMMKKFYAELGKDGVTKAEALRQAQLDLLRQEQYRKPYLWSPFILVGDWQ